MTWTTHQPANAQNELLETSLVVLGSYLHQGATMIESESIPEGLSPEQFIELSNFFTELRRGATNKDNNFSNTPKKNFAEIVETFFLTGGISNVVGLKAFGMSQQMASHVVKTLLAQKTIERFIDQTGQTMLRACNKNQTGEQQ